MEPIETRNLTKRYRHVTAVDELNLRIRAGEITGILGPNGAGKSTTIKMLVGLVRPTEGQAFVNGHDLAKDPVAARNALGYLPEVVGVYGDMTGRQFLRLSGRFYDLPAGEITRRSEELLETVGLDRAAGRKIKTYSKGMRQRVALAAALIHDPDVLILDEPLTGLDPLGIIQMRDAIRELGREKTVLISSHELHAVENLCDRVIVFKDGRILADAAVDKLTRPPAPELRVRLAVPFAAGDLTGMAGVEDATVTDEEIRLVLDGADRAPDVVAELANRGARILEVHAPRHSLEDAFLQVVAPHGEVGRT